MSPEELSYLRNLLIKYLDEMKSTYNWYSTDEVNWLLEEINDQIASKSIRKGVVA